MSPLIRSLTTSFRSSVISRNILTDAAASSSSSQQGALDVESMLSPADNSQSEPPDEAGLPPEPADPAERNNVVNGTVVQEESQSGNSSASVARQTELPGLSSGNLNVGKKTHADEM